MIFGGAKEFGVTDDVGRKNAGMMVVLSLVYSWTVIYSIGKNIQICISLHYAHKTRKVWVVVFYNFKNR